jgi:hypothetical protein
VRPAENDQESLLRFSRTMWTLECREVKRGIMEERLVGMSSLVWICTDIGILVS